MNRTVAKFTAGDRVGRWTVLGKTSLSDKGEKKWLCRCECGTERYVLERSLLYGGSVSCGCLRTERARAASPDLTGKQFGELTVLRKEDTSAGGTYWQCSCSCGGTCSVRGSLLLSGKKTDCASEVHRKSYPHIDITGKKFGRLTALAPSGGRDKSGSVVWHCRCSCGNEADVSYNNLVYANQRSCGCMRKEHSRKLPDFLTHVAGTSIDMLKSKKIPTDNTTGCRGVYLLRGKYAAKIVFQKKQYFLGTFDTLQAAAEARREAEELLFDGVAEHYRKWQQAAENDPCWAEQNPVQVFVERSAGGLRVTLLPDLSAT